MLQPTRHRLVVIQTFILQMYSGSISMRHAAAGNVLMIKMATSASQLLHSHTTVAQPAAVVVSPKRSPRVAATGIGADGPARCSWCWTPVSATPFSGEQHRADIQIQHATPSVEGRRCVSEPARSQPGESTGWITHGGIFAL